MPRLPISLVGAAGPALHLRAAELDHHRLEGALLTPIDGGDSAGSGGGETDPRHLFVLEEQLTPPDRIPHFHLHCGAQAQVVRAEKGNPSR